MPSEPLRLLLRVASLLEQLDIPYLVGGSMASSILGEPRATVDIDVVLRLPRDRAGGGVSDRQWRDVLEVLKVQAGRLGVDYLRRWAGDLGVGELLGRALRAAGIDGER